MEKIMKKYAVFMLLLVILVLSVAGCKSSKNINQNTLDAQGSKSADKENGSEQSGNTEKIDIKVAALKGPTAIGMVKMMESAKNGTSLNNYDFTISGTADEFTAGLIKGDIQIAAVPCNLAANLYNKSNGKIKVMAVNTLGVLYVLETGNTVNSVNDLKGKTIYTTGKGTTPEYTLKYLLKSAGLDPEKDVKIEFKSEAAEVAALLSKSSEDCVAMLPQPYVTTVMNQNDKVRIALDVTKEWGKYSGTDSTVVTGVIVVNTDFVNKNSYAVEQFVKEYKESVHYVNTDIDAASQLVEQFDIFKADIAKKAIPLCNITFVGGESMQKYVDSYLRILYEANPDSIGGKVPESDFYYMLKK